jgi:hypothetical protein
LFINGNNSKDLYPLGYFLRKNNESDPSTQNVGDIAGATYSWWRHRTASLGAGAADTGNDFYANVTTRAGLKQYLHTMYNWCTRGADGSAPNLILSDQISNETYELSLDDQKRYGDQKLASMGFDSVKMKQATMIWDETVPDVENGYAWDNSSWAKGTAFFLNTRFFKLVIDKQTDFVTTPFIEPENQTARTAKILFMGNTAVDNLRKLGVCYDILQTITS